MQSSAVLLKPALVHELYPGRQVSPLPLTAYYAAAAAHPEDFPELDHWAYTSAGGPYQSPHDCYTDQEPVFTNSPNWMWVRMGERRRGRTYELNPTPPRGLARIVHLLAGIFG